MARDGRLQSGQCVVVQGDELALQPRVLFQLAQDLAGQQQALLVEEDVALVHGTALVLHLEHGAARRADFAHDRTSMCAAICASDRRVSSLLGRPASSRQPSAMLCSSVRAASWLASVCSKAVPNCR